MSDTKFQVGDKVRQRRHPVTGETAYRFEGETYKIGTVVMIPPEDPWYQVQFEDPTDDPWPFSYSEIELVKEEA